MEDVKKDKRLPSSVTAAVLATDQSGGLLLLQRAEGVRGARMWCPPGGGIKDGEDPRSVVVRETKEETGLDVTPTSLLAIHFLPHELGGNRVGFTFRGKVTGGSVKMQTEEIAGYRYFSSTELEDLLVKEHTTGEVLFMPEFNIENIRRWLDGEEYPLRVIRRYERRMR